MQATIDRGHTAIGFFALAILVILWNIRVEEKQPKREIAEMPVSETETERVAEDRKMFKSASNSKVSA